MSLLACAACSTRYAVGLKACPNCRSAERAEGAAVEVPLWADTACANSGCPAVGARRRVMLPRPAVGVVELPTLLCARCGHMLPLAWPGPDVESDGDAMPKITRHGGASNRHDPESAAAVETEPTPETAADQPDTASAAGPPDAAPVPEPEAEKAQEGGESPSPGSNSSASTGKPSTTPEKSKPSPRKRTRAVSRSSQGRTESSSPGAADTSGPGTDAPTDDEGGDA